MKNNYILFLFSVLIVLSCYSLTTAQTVDIGNWIPNNTVFSTVRSGNTIYVGGAFSQIAPPTGGGTTVNLITGEPNLEFPKVNGPVISVIPDGSGGWYIGGTFTIVGENLRNNLAHIFHDGTLDENWNPNVRGGSDPTVRSLVASGPYIFVGGNFTMVGEETRNDLACIIAATGEVTTWDPNVTSSDSYVLSLDISGSVIYAGGTFTTIGGLPRNNIAAIDATTGEIIANWDPFVNRLVFTISVSGGYVYFGGTFTEVDGQPRSYIASVDAVTGEVADWVPDANDVVYSIATTESSIYVGGRFTSIGAQSPEPRNHIAELDIEGGRATDWNPDANDYVYVISISESVIYIGGTFNSIGNQSRQYISEIDKRSGEPTDWNPRPSNFVLVMLPSNETIFIGGLFFSIGGYQRNNLYAMDVTTGQILDWNPQVGEESEISKNFEGAWFLNNRSLKDSVVDPLDFEALYSFGESFTNTTVYSLELSGTTVYVGGAFSSVGGLPRNNIAAIDATTGEVITNWNPDANNSVKTLTISGESIYVGGYFTNIGGGQRSLIACLDLNSGNVTDWISNAFGNSEPFVSTIKVLDERVYVAGQFYYIGGQFRNNIAALDIVSGNAITGWDPDVNDIVYSLEISDGLLYLGGLFTMIGQVNRNCIAQLEIESGDVVADWDAQVTVGASTPTFVWTIISSGSTIYVGGSFTSIGQEFRNSIAELNATTAIATDWIPQPRYPNSFVPHGAVYTINVSNPIVNMGGFYTEVKDNVQSFFSTLTASGYSGVNSTIIGGWQTLSVPVIVDDFAKTSVWPTANSVAYSFCGSGYVQENTLENGVGYWISFLSAQDIFYAGGFLDQYEVPVCSSWNIVGSISEEVPIETNVCLFPGPNYYTSSFFIYQNGYQEVTTIKPGMGHWIKVAMDGSLSVNIDPIQCDSDSPESIEEENMDHFIVTDALGKKQDLYVANLDLNPSLGGLDLSMPPPLPEVGFDARFAQDDYIKPVSPDSGEVELEIDVETESYPVTLSWELNPENGISYSFIGDSGVGKISDIKSGFGKASFNQIRNNKIHLFASAEKMSNSINHPTVYSLMQNYPNPFNPITTIKYSLPKVSDIKIIIYDILGREVATLVNEQQQPGSYEVKWDASNISSGIYFYQLKAGGFIDTKKMILIK